MEDRGEGEKKGWRGGGEWLVGAGGAEDSLCIFDEGAGRSNLTWSNTCLYVHMQLSRHGRRSAKDRDTESSRDRERHIHCVTETDGTRES